MDVLLELLNRMEREFGEFDARDRRHELDRAEILARYEASEIARQEAEIDQPRERKRDPLEHLDPPVCRLCNDPIYGCQECR